MNYKKINTTKTQPKLRFNRLYNHIHVVLLKGYTIHFKKIHTGIFSLSLVY